MWSVGTASQFIQEIHPVAFENGWNLHLGGGVLTHGSSNNDVDIVAIPRFQSQIHDKEKLISHLVAIGWIEVERGALPSRDVRLMKNNGRVAEIIFLEVSE